MQNNDNNNNMHVPDYEPIKYITFAGKVGGEMVKRMIQSQEEKMVSEENYLDKLK